MPVDSSATGSPADSPAALSAALRATGYLADDGLATAAFLALAMHRPLFCEGEPGTGKTALAQALATVLGAELIRLQCYEGGHRRLKGPLRLGLPAPSAAGPEPVAGVGGGDG